MKTMGNHDESTTYTDIHHDIPVHYSHPRTRASDRREKKPYRKMIRRTVDRHVGQAWMKLVEQVE